MRNIFYILFLFSIAFSCRKEKLKDEQEKLLLGNWDLRSVCTDYGCPYATEISKLTIQENGLVNLVYEPKEINEKGRIVELKLVSEPVLPSPQVSYSFKIKIRKKTMFNNVSIMGAFNYVSYVNGYFDEFGNFVSEVKLFFTKQELGIHSVGNSYFIKR